MADFNDEISCYQQVRLVINTLDAIELIGEPARDIVTMYQELQRIGIVDQRDVAGVQAFIHDLNAV